jgi:hypothetical protein
MARQSKWFGIAQVVGLQLQAVAAAQQAGWVQNPVLPLDVAATLDGSTRALFIAQRGDRLQEQPAQREKRLVRLLVGAVAVSTGAPAAADALHFAARQALRSPALRLALRALEDVGPMREVEVEPELRDVATEGSLLISAFEFEYYESYAAD